jgi:hypothetical protein
VRQADEKAIEADDDLKKLALRSLNARPDQRMYGK